ncbi:hypothetical protein QJQ45_011261 [Haematococcus lacustris]|nr:hypothetical protein QJQ45_011261 [Haematococcus lacustris]
MGLIRNIASFSVALGVWAVVYPMAIQWSLDGLMEKCGARTEEPEAPLHNQPMHFLQEARNVRRDGEATRRRSAEKYASRVVGVVRQHLKGPLRTAEPFACLADCRSPWVPAARARRRKRNAKIRRSA